MPVETELDLAKEAGKRPERKSPATFEGVIDKGRKRFGIPGYVRDDYIGLVLGQIEWDAACTYRPSTGVSGNLPDGYEAAQSRVEQAMSKNKKGRRALEKYTHPPILQRIIGDEVMGSVVNPAFELPAADSVLEKRRASAVKYLHEALEWRVRQREEAKSDMVKNVLADLIEIGVEEPTRFVSQGDPFTAAVVKLLLNRVSTGEISQLDELTIKKYIAFNCGWLFAEKGNIVGRFNALYEKLYNDTEFREIVLLKLRGY